MNSQNNEDFSTHFRFAKTLARNLVKKSKISTTPIHLKEIFKLTNQDIKVEGVDLGSQDGFSINDSIIKYNSSKPVVRQRFTVAHELGHILMGHNSGSKIIDFESKDVNEQLANVFASELLVPPSILKKENLSVECLSTLAEKYWVSKDMMLWSLRNLKLDTKIGNWE